MVINVNNNLEELYLDFMFGKSESKSTKSPVQPICNKCNILKVFEQGFPVCPMCGIMDIDNPTYDIPDWAPVIALYKRRLYCQEKLKLYCGHKMSKNTYYKTIVSDLKKCKIRSVIQLKQKLKARGLKKYYKYSYNLYHDVTGKRPINLKSQDIDFLTRKFIEVESRFKLSELNGRKNFFNYNSCMFLLMKKYKFTGYKHILLPLNHLQISKQLKLLIPD
jgi:hypothetical protein